MENTFSDKVIDMKFDKYNYDEEKNFSAKGELLVTITLHEYRELLQHEAKAEVSNARHEKYKLETEVRELNNKIDQLNAIIEALGKPTNESDVLGKGDE